MQFFKKLLRPIWHKKLELTVKRNCYNKKNQNRILMFKNKHVGKRCFIIGNGPSLTLDDLNNIKNEVTFASNRIYVLYDKTEWRPTYYFCQDSTVLRKNINEIRTQVQGTKFIKPVGHNKYLDNKAICFNVDYTDYQNDQPPRFSEDLSVCAYDGYTVTYSMLQFAVYMGFKEIYLLGVDFNYSTTNKTIEKSSYADTRMYNKDKIGSSPNLEYNLKAFESAKNFADKNNIKIFNATRGGKLEVFPRIDLEGIL